ncbi:hypothetical protein DC20_13240 [Rufibacter tibetensis]|uniref:Glycosyltransferase 2-like domain-containing protein n=1 Tax=Rufibacter tibetensis TaxID=512763 RepID=A0A0P0CJW1_9BACT|nr:hypothetical protein DC20_13240 [Rufibacter tibetensis]
MQHLFQQKISSDIEWEIIIVDNASKDNTRRVAYDLYKVSGVAVPFSVISEIKPGLNYAREAGLHASQYEYLLWVDDDNWLVNDYVMNAFRIMESNLSIGMLGGVGEPVLEVKPPSWFDSFSIVYALGKQAPHSGEILNGYVYGAGATIRKSAWIKLIEAGFKSILTDRKGASLASGGDVELGDTMRLAGYKLWFDERLLFKHYLPKDRLSWNYLIRLAKGTGESGLSAAIFYFINRHPYLSVSKFRYLYDRRVLWLFTQIIKSPIALFRYFFFQEEEKYPSTFYVARTIALFTSSLKQRSFAVQAFKDICRLKQSLR